MIRCRYCYEESADDAKFCGACGKAIDSALPTSHVVEPIIYRHQPTETPLLRGRRASIRRISGPSLSLGAEPLIGDEIKKAHKQKSTPSKSDLDHSDSAEELSSHPLWSTLSPNAQIESPKKIQQQATHLEELRIHSSQTHSRLWISALFLLLLFILPYSFKPLFFSFHLLKTMSFVGFLQVIFLPLSALLLFTIDRLNFSLKDRSKLILGLSLIEITIRSFAYHFWYEKLLQITLVILSLSLLYLLKVPSRHRRLLYWIAVIILFIPIDIYARLSLITEWNLSGIWLSIATFVIGIESAFALKTVFKPR